MKKKTVLKRLLSLVLLFVFALPLTACSILPESDNNQNDSEQNNQPNAEIYAIYTLYAENSAQNGETPLSYEDWLKSIKGEKGDPGAPGKDGVGIVDIYLSDDGYLYVKLTGDTTYRNLGKISGGTSSGEPTTPTEYSQGLEYCANSDKTGYAVKGVGLCLDKDIKIPATHLDKPVTEIKYEAFYNETAITSVVLPDTVTTIEGEAFSNCTSLESINIPNGVTEIGFFVFANCTALSNINIPNSVVKIGHASFNGCTSLKSINIPNGVTTIEAGAFYGCGLEVVSLPSTISSIKDSAFKDCSSLAIINFEGSTDAWRVIYKGENCTEGIPATRVICSNGEVEFQATPIPPEPTCTIINIQGYEAGINLDWLRELAAEFEALYSDYSFEPGKTGIKFEIEGVRSTDTSSMLQSNIHMYVTSGSNGADSGRTMSAKQLVVSIDDIVSEQFETREDENGEEYLVSIREKVMPNYYNETLCSPDLSSNQTISPYYKAKYGLSDNFKFNTCYAMPSYGIENGGLSYDAYNFACYGLYLADPTWAAANPNKVFEYTSKFGTATFVKGSGTGNVLDGAKLYCGNDGICGTWDDGLPTTLQDFFILCDYMKNEHGIAPLTAYGASIGQRNRIVTAFNNALSGSAAIQAAYTYDSDGEEVEILNETSAFSADLLFGSATPNHFRANTSKVVITPENGYLARRTAGRYYALVAMQVAYDNDWYSAGSKNPLDSHLNAEERFVLNGLDAREPCGMLLEGNYWYNEAKKAGVINKFADQAFFDKPGMTEPDIRWMQMPTAVFQSEAVTEGNGRPHNGVCTGGAPIVLNAKYKDDANIVNALKMFMQYIHTDDALSLYTGSQGVYRAGMDYEIKDADYENLSSFQRSWVESYAKRERAIEPVSYEGITDSNSGQVNLGNGYEYYTIYQGGSGVEATNARNLFIRSTMSYNDWMACESYWQKLLQK